MSEDWEGVLNNITHTSVTESQPGHSSDEMIMRSALSGRTTLGSILSPPHLSDTARTKHKSSSYYASIDTMSRWNGSNPYAESQVAQRIPSNQFPLPHFYPDSMPTSPLLTGSAPISECDRRTREDKEDSDNFSDYEGAVSDSGSFRAQQVGQTTEQRHDDRGRMQRFRLTHNQTRLLMSEFAREPHPDAAERQRLSRAIPGLSPRQVQIWFQNRRAKLKRLTASDRDQMIRSRMLPEDFIISSTQQVSYHGRSSRPNNSYYPGPGPVAYNTLQMEESSMNKLPTLFENFRRPSVDGIIRSPTSTSPVSSTSNQPTTYNTRSGHNSKTSISLSTQTVSNAQSNQSHAHTFPVTSRSASLPSGVASQAPRFFTNPDEPLQSRPEYVDFNSTPSLPFGMALTSEIPFQYSAAVPHANHIPRAHVSRLGQHVPSRSVGFTHYDERPFMERSNPIQLHDSLSPSLDLRLTNSRSYEMLPRLDRLPVSYPRYDQSVTGNQATQSNVQIPHLDSNLDVGLTDVGRLHDSLYPSVSVESVEVYGNIANRESVIESGSTHEWVHSNEGQRSNFYPSFRGSLSEHPEQDPQLYHH